jgi:nitrite reductase/ring-hydroxylating ferredoxin subunit
MEIKFLKRNFFQRLLGIPATAKPVDESCWRYNEGQLTIDLNKAAELKTSGGALRCEGQNLPKRVLVVHGEDGEFRAYHNRCTHLGHRRLDPVPGTGTVQCCSVNKSTFDTTGTCIHGPAPQPVKRYDVERDGEQLVVAVSG